MATRLPNLTPDELKKVEQAKAKHTKLQKGDKFTIYPSVKDGVKSVLKGKAVTTLYPISEFYKPSLVTKALAELPIADRVEYTTAQGNIKYVDTKAIKQKLTENISKLQAFYDKQKQKPLAVTTYKTINDKAIPKLEKYFTLKTIQPNQWTPNTATVNQDINGASTAEQVVDIGQVPDLKNELEKPITGYLITDKKGLTKAIDNLQPTNYREYKNVEILASQEGNTIEGLKGLFTDLIDLTNACGITDNSGQVMSIGTVIISQIHLEVMGIIGQTLAGVLERNQPRTKVTTPVNIRLDYTGYTIPKPPIDSTIKDIENANPDKAKTIGKIYRNNEEIKDENGLFATVTDPTLLDYLPVEYQDPIKLLALYNRSNRRGLITLFRYLQDTPNPPDKIKLTDLAKHNGAYLEQIKKDGYLRDRYKKILLNELVLIKGTNTFYTYFDRSIKKEMIGSIHFFDFDISTDGKIITGLRYSDEYIKVLHGKDKAMLHLAIPKSLDTLSQPAQDIAYKIVNLFIDKYRMSKTIQGEPIKVTVAKLYRGILTEPKDKRARYQTKQTTLKLLDEINTIEQDKIIERYELIENNSLLIYPSEFTKTAYKDKTLDTALKQAVQRLQLERVQDLQKLIKAYRNDFNRSDDKRNATSYVAEDIGVTEQEINMYLIKPTKNIKPEPISDDVHDKILECLKIYET